MASGRVWVVGSRNADRGRRTPRIPPPGDTVTASDLVVVPRRKSSNHAPPIGKLGADPSLLVRGRDDGNRTILLDSETELFTEDPRRRGLEHLRHIGTDVIIQDALLFSFLQDSVCL